MGAVPESQVVHAETETVAGETQATIAASQASDDEIHATEHETQPDDDEIKGAEIWLSIEDAILHLKSLGFPSSRASIYRKYDRDDVDGVTMFAVPASSHETEMVESEIHATDCETQSDDDEIHDVDIETISETQYFLSIHPTQAYLDHIAELQHDKERLQRQSESHERIIESQLRIIESQHQQLSLSESENRALHTEIKALKAPKNVTIRGRKKGFWARLFGV